MGQTADDTDVVVEAFAAANACFGAWHRHRLQRAREARVLMCRPDLRKQKFASEGLNRGYRR